MPEAERHLRTVFVTLFVLRNGAQGTTALHQGTTALHQGTTAFHQGTTAFHPGNNSGIRGILPTILAALRRELEQRGGIEEPKQPNRHCKVARRISTRHTGSRCRLFCERRIGDAMDPRTAVLVDKG